MGTKIKSRFFTEKEVKDFRRLAKVYNYKGVSMETDMFSDGLNSTNVVQVSISFKRLTGSDEKNLGNIAKLTKSYRVTVPGNNRLIVLFKKNV